MIPHGVQVAALLAITIIGLWGVGQQFDTALARPTVRDRRIGALASFIAGAALAWVYSLAWRAL